MRSRAAAATAIIWAALAWLVVLAGPALAAANGTFTIVPTCGSRQFFPASAAGQAQGYGTVDFFGNLCTSASGGGGTNSSVSQANASSTPWVDNVTQWASVALGAPTALGTAPSGPVPGVNAQVLNFPSIQAVSGTVTATQPTNTTYAVSWTGQSVAATQSGAWSVAVNNFPTTQASNISQWGGTAVAAATAYGTAPSGSVPGVNAFVTNLPATQTVAGTVTANQGTPAAAANAWPTSDVNEANTVANSGSSTTKAQSVQAPTGAALSLDSSTQAVKTALGSPFQAGGSIGNTAFGAIPSTGSTMTTSQPQVTSTAAALAFSGSVRRTIYNPATNTASIFIGGSSSVTTTTGWEVPPGSSDDLSRFSGTVYAIAASSQTVRLISY